MLENTIANEAINRIVDGGIDASPYEPLFLPATLMAHDHRGCGAFVTAYDDVVTLPPIGHPEAFDDGKPEECRKI